MSSVAKALRKVSSEDAEYDLCDPQVGPRLAADPTDKGNGADAFVLVSGEDQSRQPQQRKKSVSPPSKPAHPDKKHKLAEEILSGMTTSEPSHPRKQPELDSIVARRVREGTTDVTEYLCHWHKPAADDQPSTWHTLAELHSADAKRLAQEYDAAQGAPPPTNATTAQGAWGHKE